jgi:hypothetical protein
VSDKNAVQSISVSERELWLIRAALQEYLASFSHTEGELIDEIKALLRHLPPAGDPDAEVNEVFPDVKRLTL